MSTTDIIVVAFLIAILVGAVAISAVPFLAKESLRTAMSDVRATMRTARTEAVKRNRSIRFEIDTGTSALRVWDGNVTAATADDTLLLEREVPEAVIFARPDIGNAVTLPQTGASTFEAVYQSGGSVSSGVGAVHLYGADRYVRISLMGSGSVQLEKWDGGAWTTEGL